MGNRSKKTIRRDFYKSPNHKRTYTGFFTPKEEQSAPGTIPGLTWILVAVVLIGLYWISKLI